MKKLDSSLFKKLQAEADNAGRGRSHYTLHPAPDDPVQRMCVVINPGSYVQPHRHATPAKWELFLILEGSASILIFDDNATLTERIDLESNGPTQACEIPRETWHTLVGNTKGAVLVEIKPGPYEPLTDKDFAAWAPKESDTTAASFEKVLRAAQVGDCLNLAHYVQV